MRVRQGKTEGVSCIVLVGGVMQLPPLQRQTTKGDDDDDDDDGGGDGY